MTVDLGPHESHHPAATDEEIAALEVSDPAWLVIFSCRLPAGEREPCLPCDEFVESLC